MIEHWMIFMELLPAYALEIAAALVCGLLLGMERERKDKPAGLRTIVLITVGSTIFMIVSTLITQVVDGPTSMVRIDPGRIAAGVVSGIGFLGAGTILHARGFVHGLTTAAVIWVAAGIGLCIGLGFPLMGFGLTLVTLGALVALDPLNRWLTRRGPRRPLTFVAPNDSLALSRIRFALQHEGVRDDELAIKAITPDEVQCRTAYHATGDATERLLLALANIEGVHGVRAVDGDV